MKKYGFLFSLIFFFNNFLISQNYQRLTDISGLGTVEDITQLEDAASQLIASFPMEFQNEFKVFSGGFYIYNELMGDGLPAYWDKLKADAQAESTYYLLFAKESTHDGICQRFWVDLKLPNYGAFSCMDANYFEIILSQVSDPVNTINTNAFNPAEYAEAEIAGIQNLKTYISRLKNCCENGAWNSACGNCMVDYNEMINFFENKNFLEIVNAEFNIVNESHNGNLNSDYGISYTINGETTNLTSELDTFLNEFEQIGLVQARVTKFTESNCNDFSSFEFLNSSGNIYTEEIIILEYDNKTRVFFRILADFPTDEFKHLSAEHRLVGGIPWFVKKGLSWFFRRVGQTPAGAIVGIIADYSVMALFEYWFDNDNLYTKEDGWDYARALWNVVKKRGVLGGLAVVAQNVVNSPVADFVLSFVDYAVTTPPEQWNFLAAMATSLTGVVVRAIMSPSSLKFFKGGAAFISDITSIPNGPKLLIACLENKSTFKAWKGLFNTGLRTDIPWLTRASKWLDEGAEFAADGTGKLTKNGEDILQIKNDKILPDKFDFDPSTQKPKPGGTAIGEPSNGYQVYKHGDDLSVRRVPSETGISPSNISTLNGGGKGHCLHRHGADVTDDALKKRATEGRAPDGSARTKNNDTETYIPPKSSKFNSPEKINEALTEVGPGSSKYNAAKSAAESSGANSFPVYHDFGAGSNMGKAYQIPGSNGWHPTSSLPLSGTPQELSGLTKVKAIFIRDGPGDPWYLLTMYPD